MARICLQLGAAVALAVASADAFAQDASYAPVVAPAPDRDALPFSVGERLTYNIRVGRLGRGSAVAEIKKVDTVRGKPVFHSIFTVNGSLLFFKVRDYYESWFDPHSMVSLQYRQDIDQGPYDRLRKYDIYPERGVYFDSVRAQEFPTSGLPLDDGSFLYFLRTIPLEVGKTYSFNRYFKPDRNPVILSVVRRERIAVPAGEFDAIVLQPRIKAKGIFAEDAHAEVWLSDDDRRIMLMLRTKLPTVGTATFQLRSIEQLPAGGVAGK
jgi:hypothetical protein